LRAVIIEQAGDLSHDRPQKTSTSPGWPADRVLHCTGSRAALTGDPVTGQDAIHGPASERFPFHLRDPT